MKKYDGMAEAMGDSPSDEPDDMPDEDEGGMPPEFETAYQEYVDNPSPQSFWDAVEACVGKHGPGLAIVIGKDKK